MASLLKSVFGAGTQTQEQENENENKDENSNNSGDVNSTPNNPSNQPQPKQLSKEELAARRLASLETTLIAQPTISQSPEPPQQDTKPPSSKKRRLDPKADKKKDTQTVDDVSMNDLSEEMKLAMKLSMNEDNDTNESKKNEENENEKTSKEQIYEFLVVMYILQIRHNNLDEYNKNLSEMNIFKQYFDDSFVTNTYCIIDDETPIDSQSIEAIFIDRFQKEFVIHQSSFKYLLKCYERCCDFNKRITQNWTLIIPKDNQLNIINNIQQCILTFSGILLSTPDLTSIDDFMKSQQEFQHILSSPNKGRDFPKGFLSSVFDQIEDDAMDDVLLRCDFGDSTYPMIMQQIKNTSMNVLRSNYHATINALIKLCTVEKFALYLIDPKKNYWIPNEFDNPIGVMKFSKINANTMIVNSILGGLLNLSYETQDIQSLFSKLTTEGIKQNPVLAQNIQSSFKEYRLIITSLQDGMFTIVNNLIKTKNKKVKGNIIRLFSYFIYINLDRGKMRFDHKIVSKDGFMLNLNYVLLKLCDPIIKKNLLKKIDSNYFLLKKTENYMTWEDATRLSCDSNELKAFEDKLYNDETESKSNDNNKPSFGFTTEVFCLTLESLHLGFSCIYSELNRLQRHIDRLRREARQNPMAAFMINMNVANLEKRLLAQIAHLMEQRFILAVGRFYGFFCRWLLHLSQDPNNNKDKLSVIPEYYIEDMSRFFRLFLTERAFVQIIQRGQSPFDRREVIKCLIYLMSSSSPIRNIYQKACLCEVLLLFLPPKVLQFSRTRMNQTSNNNLMLAQWHQYEFESHEFNIFESCKKELVQTLLILYADVERTGSPGQYYEKFKFRLFITKLLKFLFHYKVHQNNLSLFYKNQPEKFIGFLNMLINDLIYTLDHGFDGLTEIRQIENEPEPATNNNQQNQYNPMDPFGLNPSNNNQNEAMQRQENLAEIKDTVRHYMNLANESIELLKYVVDHTTDSFMDNLILPRIAILVCVYLDRLGHGSELRVKGNLREDYNFNAGFLLTSVVEVFNKLCSNQKHRELFLSAIVDDEAHFREISFKKGINVLKKKQLMNINEITKFEQSLNELIKKFEEKKNVEVMLGDIPTKYLDPIMQTLMTDPVILGKDKSKDNQYIMDRKVIERHLMNNPNNPFNREPLTKDDLVPDIELKKEIDEWIKTTLAKHKNKNNKDNDEQKQQ